MKETRCILCGRVIPFGTSFSQHVMTMTESGLGSAHIACAQNREEAARIRAADKRFLGTNTEGG